MFTTCRTHAVENDTGSVNALRRQSEGGARRSTRERSVACIRYSVASKQVESSTRRQWKVEGRLLTFSGLASVTVSCSRNQLLVYAPAATVSIIPHST